MLIVKNRFLALTFYLLGALAAICMERLHADPIQVGSGPNSSYLLIEASLFSATLVYQYNYTYDPDHLLSGYDLLTAVDAFDSNLQLDFINYGTPESPNYFLNAVTYNSVTLTNTGFPDYSPYWAQWVSGGRGGYPTQGTYLNGVWDYGSGASDPYRTLAQGSFDGYVYSDGSTPPSISPVPEPNIPLLLLAGVVVLFPIWKKWLNKKNNAG